jgi:hypothetical protein
MPVEVMAALALAAVEAADDAAGVVAVDAAPDIVELI